MSFEAEWQAEEARVDALIKEANRYVGALKGWKKACQIGHYNNRTKAATTAVDLAPKLTEPALEAASAWSFDVAEYLSSEAWRREIMDLAKGQDFRLSEESDTLISSPVVVRAQAGRGILQIGKVNWPTLRPKVVLAELKRLRERSNASNSQEFLESLYGVSQRVNEPVFLLFKTVYDLFSLTPGWKRDNPPAKFAQDIYALYRSDIQFTRSGKKIEFIHPTGLAKEKETYVVIAEDGKPLKFHGISFGK